MTRAVEVKAHKRTMPERVVSDAHAELFAAYERDKTFREIAEEIAYDLGLDPDCARNRREALR